MSLETSVLTSREQQSIIVEMRSQTTKFVDWAETAFQTDKDKLISCKQHATDIMQIIRTNFDSCGTLAHCDIAFPFDDPNPAHNFLMNQLIGKTTVPYPEDDDGNIYIPTKINGLWVQIYPNGGRPHVVGSFFLPSTQPRQQAV